MASAFRPGSDPRFPSSSLFDLFYIWGLGFRVFGFFFAVLGFRVLGFRGTLLAPFLFGDLLI